VQKNQLELLGNHQQNHLRAVGDQAVQADLAADDHRVVRVDLVADPVHVNDCLIQE
jgi:hypothetical protein